MSHTSDLINGYGHFFVNAAKFAFSPYTATFCGVGDTCDGFDPIAATIAVGVLTFVVPVLPTLFSITASLAMAAAAIAIASMFFLFPAAFIADLMTGNVEFNDRRFGWN